MRQRAPLVLASASRARLALLRAAGFEVEAAPADLDETALKRACRERGCTAAETALHLAHAKAAAIAAARPDPMVIGADQILVCDTWYDKPESVAEARLHLIALRGQTHHLVTAAVCHRGGARLWQTVAMPRLTMRAFSDAFLEDDLLAEGDALTTTVGAYRLEGLGIHLFERIEGEHAAILGLPLLALLAFLREAGVVD